MPNAEAQPPSTPVLVITGPVGVGKTTVAAAISELLIGAHIAHAVVDLDWLRWCYPPPADDRFHSALGLQNLVLVWANYRAAGAERLILIDIVETRALLAEYQAVIPAATITVVRLHAALPTLHSRLAGREAGASLVWHQQRAAELLTLMEAHPVEDFRVETEGKAVLEIAQEIVSHIQWA
jgi:broad-specificity NMP kinase